MSQEPSFAIYGSQTEVKDCAVEGTGYSMPNKEFIPSMQKRRLWIFPKESQLPCTAAEQGSPWHVCEALSLSTESLSSEIQLVLIFYPLLTLLCLRTVGGFIQYTTNHRHNKEIEFHL